MTTVDTRPNVVEANRWTGGCWASILGGCAGGITGEHVVSECLFEKTVRLRGLNWCANEFRTVGVKSLVANCLCGHHNSSLSPCDTEAKRFQEAIRWLASDFDPLAPFNDTRRLSGFLFAKWLAKTACNFAVWSNRQPPPALVRYAFAAQDDADIRVYLCVDRGDFLPIDLSHIGSYWLTRNDDPNQVLVCFKMYGFPFVLGTVPIDGAEEHIAQAFEIEAGLRGVMNRVHCIAVDGKLNGFGPLRRGEIRLDWPGMVPGTDHMDIKARVPIQ